MVEERGDRQHSSRWVTEQKAEQQITHGKGTEVALGEALGLICGTPAKRVGSH